jgi:hypothetical protein
VRLDKGPSDNTSVMLVIPNEKHPVETIANKLHILDDSMNVTFFEAKTNW